MRSTSTTTTTRPPAAPPVCQVTLGEYKHSNLIATQCAQLDYWKQQEQDEAAHSNHSYCQIDPRTKVMTCQRQEKCTGGEKVRHRFANRTKIMTYHCDSHCKGTLYFGCCRECKRASQTPKSIGVDKIMCNGCDDATKKQVEE